MPPLPIRNLKAPPDIARLWPRLPFHRRLYIAALVWRALAPVPVRLAVLHSLTALSAIIVLPPPPELPPVMLPVAWAASYAAAVTIYPLVFSA